jgi:hypothetical protein
MTYFYDRTQAIHDWCRKTRLRHWEAIGIIRERYRQVQEYIAFVGERTGITWLDPLAPRMLTRSREWVTFRDLARSANLDVEVIAFWDLLHYTLDDVSAVWRQTPPQFYDPLPDSNRALWDVLCGPFEPMHDLAHEIQRRTNYSDSPVPPRRFRKLVRDSDSWLNKRYPEAPKY